MESTEGYKLEFTVHARQQLDSKNVDMLRANDAFANPDRIYPNKKYEGQFRIVGNGLCLIGKPMKDVFRVFTVYEDGVMTPPRPDQLLTEEGRKYAELYRTTQQNGRTMRDNEYYPRVNKRRKASSEIRHVYIR